MLVLSIAAILTGIVSCSPTATSSNLTAQNSDDRDRVEVANSSNSEWRSMTEAEVERAWDSILNTPLGIAGLNQLAIEGFINPTCEKSFYAHEDYGLMQFILRVECNSDRGVSTALGYDEMRIIYSLFESNIEDFEVERVHQENRQNVTPLPTN